MDPLANLVVLWGGGLLFANLIFDPTFASLRSAATSGDSGALTGAIAADKGTMNAGVSGVLTNPTEVVVVGLLTLVVMSFIANMSDKAAKAMLYALGGLTILWLISYNDQKATGQKVAGAAGQAGSTASQAVGAMIGTTTATAHSFGAGSGNASAQNSTTSSGRSFGAGSGSVTARNSRTASGSSFGAGSGSVGPS